MVEFVAELCKEKRFAAFDGTLVRGLFRILDSGDEQVAVMAKMILDIVAEAGVLIDQDKWDHMLQVAAQHNDVEIVGLFLDAGADPTAYGSTALTVTLQGDFPE